MREYANLSLEKIGQFQVELLRWYQLNKRDLPWREDPSPYRVWISEIMLQQTRVETVIPYYNRFIKRLPSVKELADVSEQELLKLWEGLGYYSRARNLKETALKIVSHHQGLIPKKYEALVRLKGIGEYSAGAIASIAFGERVPAIDGNVIRVISRVFLIRENISQTSTKKKISSLTWQLLPDCNMGDFNQGLIELGALVCKKKNPKCAGCPLAPHCNAFKAGIQEELPITSKKKPLREEERTVLLLQYHDQYALQKRPVGELLGGLWELPNRIGFFSEKEVVESLENEGFSIETIVSMQPEEAVFSHIRWKMRGYKIQVNEKKGSYFWNTAQEIKEKYSIASAFRCYCYFE